MPSLDRRIVSWMRTHQSTISSSTLALAGISRTQVKRLVAAGVLERLVDGAYQFAGVEPSELTRCAALCASHSNLVIGGPTAGRIWQIRRSPFDDLIHAIGPPNSQPCREPWVRVYRTALHDEDIVIRLDGIRITSPPRTVVDLTRHLDDEGVASAVEYAVAKRLCTVSTLYRVASRLNTPGRPWVRRFLRILEARTPGKPRESDWERRVCNALVARGIGDLDCQVHQVLPGHGAVRFDFAIPEIKWVLEVDVHPEHRTLKGQSSDHRRDRHTRRSGWQVERVGQEELTRAFDVTIDDVIESIRLRRQEAAGLVAAGLWPPPTGR